MPITMLFDLDDTLLDSNMDVFIPAYFQALSGFLADKVDPNIMLPALMSGTRMMIANNDPAKTLRQVFDAEFFPAIGAPRERLQKRIEQFYSEVFPSLKSLTKPRPEAVSLVEWSFAQGHLIAIATNPLFPQAAIYHRMNWAGLPAEKYPFQIISSYESFHFTKPNPAYFAEVLGRLGWPDGPVLLVGDDLKNDIAGSRKLGLASFWVDSKTEAPPGENLIAASGTIADVRPWLENYNKSLLIPSFNGHEALLAVLRATPAAIGGIVEEIDDALLKRRPKPDEWSLTEIVCHLRDTEMEGNLPRISAILNEEDPFLAARNTDTWAFERQYNDQNFSNALEQFISARLEVLDILHELSEQQWLRPARDAIFGPSTLNDIVKFIAEHDHLHVRQVKETAR
jgi:HAD superfamily hydrolase (TIGR01549 family)